MSVESDQSALLRNVDFFDFVIRAPKLTGITFFAFGAVYVDLCG
jgi:hypothetical protein